MSPPVRKALLAAHLTVSVGWIGSVLAYLALAVLARSSESDATVRAAWIGMDVTGWYVIVPLTVTSFATGVLLAVATRWGLLRHYWVLFSLLLTAVAMVVLVLHMPSVATLADAARNAGEDAAPHAARLLTRLRQSDLLHPAAGLVVLLAVHVMNVYKPAGLTRYGWRMEQRRQARAPADSLEPSRGRTPS